MDEVIGNSATVMPFPIHSREERSRLEIRAKPYFARLADGVQVGYRKGKCVSRWVVRRYDGSRYRMATIPDVQPDDEFAPDGKKFLSFQQVVAKIMTEEKIPVRCSFCGKNSKQVEKLIAGPSVFICNECVAACQLYLDYPNEQERLLFKDGKPVFKDGRPVFVPVSDEEKAQTHARYDFDVSGRPD